MSSIGDVVFDEGLDQLNTTTGVANALHICSAEPTTYVEAITTYTLGNDDGNLAITGPADKGGGGREVTMTALAGGAVTGTGTVIFYAIVDTVGTALLAVGPVTSQAVTSGNTFSLTSVTIGIPDPA